MKKKRNRRKDAGESERDAVGEKDKNNDKIGEKKLKKVQVTR